MNNGGATSAAWGAGRGDFHLRSQGCPFPSFSFSNFSMTSSVVWVICGGFHDVFCGLGDLRWFG